jgi:hypothetical protein
LTFNRGCGDPTSPLRWTSKSTRHLADALGARGFQVSDDTVGRLLRERGYRLGSGAGWVSVGTDHDTAAFAVATLARWWEQTGRQVYPQATRLGMTVRPELDHGGYPT